MPQYMVSMFQPDGPPPPPEVLEPIMAGIGRWLDDAKAAGVLVFNGGLTPPGSATVVRTTGGETLITDGPYTEGKEHIGGFEILEVPDLDAALDWVSRLSAIVPLPLEVRAFSGGT